MKRAIILIGLFASILIVVVLLRIEKPQRDGNEPEPTINQHSSALDTLGSARQLNERHLDEEPSLQGLFSAVNNYKWNPKKEAEHKKSLPFELLGEGGETERVIDAAGNVLISSTAEHGVYGLDVSPGKKRFVVSLGDGKSRVFEPQSGLVIDLPSSPEPPNMVGFSGWRWLSEDLLITTSGVLALDDAGKPLSCCEGHNLSSTQMFAFRVSTRALSPVSKLESNKASVFRINRVSSEGYVEIVTDGTHLAPGRSVGWYRFNEQEDHRR